MPEIWFPRWSMTCAALSGVLSKPMMSQCWHCDAQMALRVTPPLSDGDHDASVAWFSDIITGRHDQIELPAAGDGDRVAVYPILRKPVADSRGAGNRQRLIGAQIAERVGMADDLDLVDGALFDVVEHRAVKGHRFRG